MRTRIYACAMNNPTWWAYVKHLSGPDAPVQKIADAAGVSGPQVSRWKTGENAPRAEAVIRFARAYDRPPLEALVAAGFVTPAEARATTIEVSRPLSNAELVDEIRSRLLAGESAGDADVDVSGGVFDRGEVRRSGGDRANAANSAAAASVKGLKVQGEGR